VLRVLPKKRQEGTRIVYIPGNHDDDMRALIGHRFGNVEVHGHCVHMTAAGRRLLVLHGDEFDAVMQHGFLAALVGSVAYRRRAWVS
jgi:UDP-2,3-diacylglucosamine pyrophosphatase LpxH